MNKNSNTYIFLYAVIMVIIVAAVLSFIATQLKHKQEENVEVQKKQDILSAILVQSNADSAVAKYDMYIKDAIVITPNGKLVDSVDAFSINMKKEMDKAPEKRLLPIYEGVLDDGSKKHIIPMRGKGLWGPIWGYVSLGENYNEIYGASFDHKSETPGLGAEINTRKYQEQFEGKKIFNESDEFTSILVVKAEATEDTRNKVDAISGGTITSKSLQDMLEDNLSLYMPYFKRKRANH